MDDPDEAAARRQRDRAASVEATLAAVRQDLGEQAYPVTSEELAATYADTLSELPNETESPGSAFDRLDDEFTEPEEAYEALLGEFEQGEYADTGPAGEAATWSAERADDERPPADEGSEGGRRRSVARARQSEAESFESDSDDGE